MLSSRRITISPTLGFLWERCHLECFWRLRMYSVDHLFQKCHTRAWQRCHLRSNDKMTTDLETIRVVDRSSWCQDFDSIFYFGHLYEWATIEAGWERIVVSSSNVNLTSPTIRRRWVSDYGTNFVGAARTLKELVNFLEQQKMQEAVFNFCSTQGIEWQFIPEHTPHFGGLWEAVVKSMKPYQHWFATASNETSKTRKKKKASVVRSETRSKCTALI